jgi:phospholipase/carboxylesterase
MTFSRFSRDFWVDESSPTEMRQPAPCPGESEAPESSPAEVILSCDTAASSRVCARTRRVSRPRGVFVPQNYEPNYAYPLIVWLHDAGRSEREIAEVLPRISMRNYLGLAPRGTARAQGDSQNDDRFAWSRSDRSCVAFQDELCAGVRQLRRDFHVHTERVFLIGAGDGGTMAWDLFLSRPEWFAGVAVLGGRFPLRQRPLRRFRQLQGRRLFLSSDGRDAGEMVRAKRVGRLMHNAGLDVSLRTHSGNRSSRSLLRQIDRWIMQGIGGCL